MAQNFDALKLKVPLYSVAVLVQGYIWNAGVDRIRLSPGVSIGPLENSKVWALYERMCTKRGLDGGEPNEYDFYLLFEPSVKRVHFRNYGDPYSLVDRVCNILTICTAMPPVICRVIDSENKFRSMTDTQILSFAGGQLEYLTRGSVTLSTDACEECSRLWRKVLGLNPAHPGQKRIFNALTYFYYTWKSFYLDQICLNLAIVLETIFAPHTQSETVHQVAYNIAWFQAATPSQREDIYALVKKFYGLRSSIVHGGDPNDRQLSEIVPAVFVMVSEILRRILRDDNLLGVFTEESKRRRLFREYLFSRT